MLYCESARYILCFVVGVAHRNSRKMTELLTKLLFAWTVSSVLIFWIDWTDLVDLIRKTIKKNAVNGAIKPRMIITYSEHCMCLWQCHGHTAGFTQAAESKTSGYFFRAILPRTPLR